MPIPGVNIDKSLLGQNANFSLNTDLGSKIGLDSLKNTATAGFNKLTGAVKGAFGAKPAGLNIPTSFPRKDLAPPKTPPAANTAPPQFKPKSVPSNALVYPAFQKYFTSFTFYQYQRVGATETAKTIPTASIVLPIPQNLSESFSAEYDMPALGAVTGSVADSLIGSIRQGQSDVGGGMKDKTAGGTIAAAIGAGTIFGLSKIPKVGENAAAIGRMALGLTPNPYLAVVFRNVSMRTHSFQYKFAPRSLEEMKTVKEIIRQLKIRMLPGLTKGSDILFTFPDTCDITYKRNDNTFDFIKIKKCVLKDLSVNYSPNGPAFFKTGDPVVVEIQMTFQEIAPFTREDMGEGRELVALNEIPVNSESPLPRPANPLPGTSPGTGQISDNPAA